MSLSAYSSVIVHPRRSTSSRASRNWRSTPFSRPSTSSEIRAYTATLSMGPGYRLLARQRDTLFPGGVGNTQKDAERFNSLINDVSSRIFDVLPDDTWFYPGHGDDSAIGEQRPHLAEWRERGW